MVVSITILSITILFQFITNCKLLFDNRKLQKKIKSLETEIKQHDEIIPGDKVTFKMGLTYADKLFVLLFVFVSIMVMVIMVWYGYYGYG